MSKKVYTLIFLCIILIQQADAQDWLSGTWKGTPMQNDKTTWDMTLSVSSSSDIQVNYPGLGCSGYWDIVTSGTHTAEAREMLTKGIDRCDVGVEITITKLSATEIGLAFYLRSYFTDPIAMGRLKKTY